MVIFFNSLALACGIGLGVHHAAKTKFKRYCRAIFWLLMGANLVLFFFLVAKEISIESKAASESKEAFSGPAIGLAKGALDNLVVTPVQQYTNDPFGSEFASFQILLVNGGTAPAYHLTINLWTFGLQDFRNGDPSFMDMKPGDEIEDRILPGVQFVYSFDLFQFGRFSGQKMQLENPERVICLEACYFADEQRQFPKHDMLWLYWKSDSPNTIKLAANDLVKPFKQIILFARTPKDTKNSKAGNSAK